MQATDRVGNPSGKIEILVKDLKGNVVDRRAFHNIIVNSFRTQEAHVLSGDGLADRVISLIQLGTDGTAETAADVGITGAVDVAVSSYTYPTTKSVQFEGTLAFGSGNGVAFREVGLLYHDTTLAARRTFAVMTKSALFSWTIRWTISWS